MIYFYSGTPGSGKSLEVAKDIVNKLTIRKQNVIANIKINTAFLEGKNIFGKPKRNGKFFYLDNEDFSPRYFYDYAMRYHKKGIEGQTLIVIDEAQMLFSPTVIKIRMQSDKMFRRDWLEFFTQHRHLGFNIVIVSQFDKLIDPQVRCLFEYNHIHRKVNNFKLGWLFSLFKISVFCSVVYWYGCRERIGCHFFLYSKRYAKIYDSYKLFDDVKKKDSKELTKIVKGQVS